MYFEKHTISISDELRRACPAFKAVALFAEVTNTPHNDALWKEIETFTQQLRATTTLEDIKQQPAIAANREGYKRCGKDPSRYRPSSEALRRRLMRGLELYQIDTLVDIVNLVSLESGYSIGGFDADKIVGDSLVLGIGKKDEPYEGIGRGILNIEGMPVYRDAVGGVGTPTSDNERTKMDLDTCHILTIINCYDELAYPPAVGRMKELLAEYASARSIEEYPFE
jgi:DNA/RNA-binding domain of Phe-tRNA-synthetase-like protein